MCVIVIQVHLKTFFFLRVFPVLTPVIVMLKTVIYDLRIFMLFYIILIGLFCQVFAVLGLGNAYPGKEETLRRYLGPKGGGGQGPAEALNPEESDTHDRLIINQYAQEYSALGLHMGEFMWTLRLSIGDSAAITAS